MREQHYGENKMKDNHPAAGLEFENKKEMTSTRAASSKDELNMPDEIWVYHMKDDGYTGDSFIEIEKHENPELFSESTKYIRADLALRDSEAVRVERFADIHITEIKSRDEPIISKWHSEPKIVYDEISNSEALKALAWNIFCQHAEAPVGNRAAIFKVVDGIKGHLHVQGHLRTSDTIAKRDVLDRLIRQKKRYTDSEFGDKELAALGAQCYDILRDYG